MGRGLLKQVVEVLDEKGIQTEDGDDVVRGERKNSFVGEEGVEEANVLIDEGGREGY